MSDFAATVIGMPITREQVSLAAAVLKRYICHWPDDAYAMLKIAGSVK